jgi:MFS family permease
MKNNQALKTLFLYNSIFVFANNLLGPLYTVYIQKFDINVFSISSVWATFIFFTTVFTFLLAKIGDRIKEKEYFLMVGFLIRALGWLLYLFAHNILFIIIIQIVLALGEAFGSPAFDAIFSEHVDKNFRMSEYSNWRIIYNLSMVLATIIGGFVVYKFGFTPLFLSVSGISLFCFFGVLTKPRDLL